MKFWIFIVVSFLASNNGSTQNPNITHINTDSLSNRLFLTVVDVIQRIDVNDFEVTIYVGYDTLSAHVHSAKDYSLNLYPGMPYRIMITKSGFDTLRAEWTQPADTADVYADFYMRKTGITKKERKEACRSSRYPIYRSTGDDGGFQVMNSNRHYFISWSVYIYSKSFSSGHREFLNARNRFW